jgi:hypothetical protein
LETCKLGPVVCKDSFVTCQVLRQNHID